MSELSKNLNGEYKKFKYKSTCSKKSINNSLSMAKNNSLLKVIKYEDI
jgi:hypothetical protein